MWQTYYLVTEVEQALALLAEHGPQARIMAGATDLLNELERHVRPGVSVIVDISNVPGLATVEINAAGEIQLGALVTHNQCVAAPLIVERAWPLAQACWEVGAPQIRNRATVAGNLITASPANDTITPLLALDAAVTLRSVRGERRVALREFYTGVRRTLMLPDELLTAITFAPMKATERGMFVKMGLRKAQAISVANATVIVDLAAAAAGGRANTVRIALGAVAPTVIRAHKAEAHLSGKVLDAAEIAAASELAAQEARPINDLRSPAVYRRGIVRVAVARALSAIAAGDTRGWFPAEKPVMLWGGNGTSVAPAPIVAWRSDGSGGAPPFVTRINGAPFSFSGAYKKTLLRMLREDAGLTGTKEGCSEGECGACTVFLNGAAVMACMVPAPCAQGAEIVTVEGLAAPDGTLHAVQRAFVEQGAVQCGYCTPGLLMAGVKLLEECPQPTRWEAQQAITGNLCRCTGYYKILDALQHAGAPAAHG